MLSTGAQSSSDTTISGRNGNWNNPMYALAFNCAKLKFLDQHLGCGSAQTTSWLTM